MQAGLADEVDFDGRITAGVVDGASVDLGDGHVAVKYGQLYVDGNVQLTSRVAGYIARSAQLLSNDVKNAAPGPWVEKAVCFVDRAVGGLEGCWGRRPTRVDAIREASAAD